MSYLSLILSALLVLLNTAIVSIILAILALFKIVLPIPASQRFFSRLANTTMWVWATINKFLLSVFNKVDWQISGYEKLNKRSWYLLISNHISWTDIVILSCLFKDTMPMTKFFVKKELLYVPFVGLACWALDMPFMRRYSHKYLVKHPEKRKADLESTRKACQKFKMVPTTIVNYVEGSRVTPEKQKATNSPYKHLLRPKTGGIAYSLAAMGEQFDYIVDVTLAYPKNREQPFKDLLMGKMKQVVVDINLIEVDEQVKGDYFNDSTFKRQFQQWLTNVWEEKDKRLEAIYNKD